MNSSTGKLPTMDLNHEGGRGFNSISELMRAMILRTIDDFNSLGELHEQALAYMSDEDEFEYIFSFGFICRHLGLDPAKTRHAIMFPTHKISTRRRAA